jgi:hypothetical protein
MKPVMALLLPRQYELAYAFGLFAVTAMLVCYALEDLSPWFILAFGVACALGSAYGFLQGAWPFGVVEAVWFLVALRPWRWTRQSTATESAAKGISPSQSRPLCSESRWRSEMNSNCRYRYITSGLQ